MRKLTMLLFSLLAFVGVVRAQDEMTYLGGSLVSLDPGKYVVYYEDGNGTKHYLWNNRETCRVNSTTDPKFYDITVGNVTHKDAYAPYAYFFDMGQSKISNPEDNDAMQIQVELAGKAAPYNNYENNRLWESQVIFKNTDGKYAIRTTNCKATEGWRCDAYITISEDGQTVKGIQNAANAGDVYKWTIEEVEATIGEMGYTTLNAALNAAKDGETVTLIADVELAEMVTFPAGKTATLDLNGKSISMEESIISTAYALQNLGNLTLKDGVGTGSINARGIYNGAEDNTSAEMTVLSGTYNAKGTGGGAAIFNYAKAVLTGGTFTSVDSYSLNNRAGASMEIAQDVKATGGIYNTGAELTVNGANISNSRSGSHTIYAWSSAVIINDGTIHNNNAGNATVFADGTSTVTIDGGKFSIANGKDIHNWTSCLIDATGSAAYTINDGEFKGHIRVQTGAEMTINGGTFENTHAEAYAISGTVSVKGGTFTDDASKNFASTYLAEGYIIAENNGVYTVAQPVAKIGETTFASLQDALNAAASGVGEITVEILEDINLTGTTWAPVTVSGPGYPLVTVEGNEHTITGLTDMLFAATWAGKSGLIIKNLTIANSAIVNDENDANGNVGVGAFIGYPQASATITLENCHLKSSSVKGGHWTGGLIGMAGGYNGNDGPVFMNLTIKNCSVTDSEITGKGSAGALIGHGSCSAWTNVVIENTTVEDNTITSTGSSANKAGSVMGTIGAAGQPTTVNGETKTGGAYVSAMVAGNTVTSGGTEITTIYGRQGTSTGMLYIVGGSYDKYPIEENVAYAAVVDGYALFEKADGTYGVTYLIVDGAGDYEFECENGVSATVENLTYTRTLASDGFNALFVPFGFSADAAPGFEFFKFDEACTANGEKYLVVSPADYVNANAPYLVRPIGEGEEAKKLNIQISNATLLDSKTNPGSMEVPGEEGSIYTITGTYSQLNGAEDVTIEKSYGISVNGYFALIGDGSEVGGTLGAFRFYMQLPEGANARNIGIRIGGESDDATGIVETENGKVKTEIYDLSGRRVQNAQKGIFIVNGKKVVK